MKIVYLTYRISIIKKWLNLNKVDGMIDNWLEVQKVASIKKF